MMEELSKYDILLIVGNYGAGKSQLAREHFGDRKRINRHELRYHLVEMTNHGRKWSPEDWDEELEGLVKHLETDIIQHYLERRQKIIIDNTSLTRKSRAPYVALAKKFHQTIACIFLDRDISVLLRQNRMREYAVPDHVIIQLHAKTEVPSPEEGFGRVVVQ